MNTETIMNRLIYGEIICLYNEDNTSNYYFLRLLVDKENPSKKIYTLLLSTTIQPIISGNCKPYDSLINIYYMLTVYPEKKIAGIVVNSSADGQRSYNLLDHRSSKSDFSVGLFKNKGLSSYCLGILIEIVASLYPDIKLEPLHISGSYAIDQHDRRDYLYKNRLQYTYPDNYNHLKDYRIHNKHCLKELCFFDDQKNKFKVLDEKTLINASKKHVAYMKANELNAKPKDKQEKTFISIIHAEMSFSRACTNFYGGFFGIFREINMFILGVISCLLSVFLGICASTYVPISFFINKLLKRKIRSLKGIK